MDPFRIYIGWDSREAECADVLANSLRKHSSIPLDIRYLKLVRPHEVACDARTVALEVG